MKALLKTFIYIVLLFPITAFSAEKKPSFIDSLDMSSPQQTVENAVEAYRNSDYFRFFFYLSPDARMGVNKINAMYFSTRPLFPELDEQYQLPPKSDLNPELAQTKEGYSAFSAAMTSADILFEDLMLSAEADDLLPFSFGKNIKLGTMKQEGEYITIPVDTDGGKIANLDFTLVLGAHNKWYIDRISWQGSDVKLRPWGVDPDKDKTPTESKSQ